MATTLVALLTASAAWAQDVKIEPANWWVGMKNPDVQLMLHATDIANFEPSIDEKGIEITNVTRTDNPNYLFVTLSIGKKANAGDKTIALKSGDKTINVKYPLLNRRKDSAKRIGFSSDDAFFLLMPDRFANADPNNDSTTGTTEKANRNEPYGRHGGDLKGVIEHLDYIKNLGMTTLWMTPVMTNDMPQSSYHGYAITNFYEIDPRFGSLDDFKNLTAELHKRGMKHVMDMVFNHCGTGYWWMKDLPAKDWLNKWYDKDGNEIFVRSNYRLSIINDPHASQADLDLALKGWFDSTMADMNLTNPLVRNYLIQSSIWWVEMADLDGIRQDTYPYSDVKAMAEWCDRLKSEYPFFNIVGECWISEAAKLAPWQKGFGKANGIEDSGLPTIMDFPLQEAMIRAFGEGEGWGDGANRLYDSFANDLVYPDPMNILIFGENHDTGRLLTKLQDDEDALRMAMALLATARGIPQLYYGTEALMKGNGNDGHANIRGDFPGGWANDTINYFTQMPAAPKAMYDYIARLFNFRQKSMAIRRGSMTQYTTEGNVYTFFRYDATTRQQVMTILNLAKEDREISLERYNQIPNAHLVGTDITTGNAVDANGKITVKARTAMVINMK